MKKKSNLAVITKLLALAISFSSFTVIATIEANCEDETIPTFYIDPNEGYDLEGRGTLEVPWRTITYALTQIKDLKSSKICLSEGTYSTPDNGEHFPLVIYSNVTIEGSGAYRSIIDAANQDQVIKTNNASHLTFKNLEITGGKEFGSTGAGLELITTEQVDILIENCYIHDNNNEGQGGGGIYVNSRCGSLVIKDSIISNNSSSIGGGGVSTLNICVTIENTRIENNKSGVFGGGGISLKSNSIGIKDTNVDIKNCVFLTNSSDIDGGGAGGAIHVSRHIGNNHNFSLSLSKSIFRGNHAERGGAIAINNVSAHIENCLFTENSAINYGGCLNIINTSIVKILCCTLDNNSVEHDGGGGIFLYNSANLYAKNAIFTNNNKYAIYIFGREYNVKILDNCNFFNNPDGIYRDGNGNNITAIEDLTLNFAHNNIGSDPLYAPDCRIQIGSPCLDTGSNDLEFYRDSDFMLAEDLEGNQRPVDSNNNGSAEYDIGAYEYPL